MSRFRTPGGANRRPTWAKKKSNRRVKAWIPPSLKPELKFVDYEVNSKAFSITWEEMDPAVTDSVSSVAQGDGESSRDGRVYYIHSIHMRFFSFQAGVEGSNAPLDDQHGRVCLVLDKHTNGEQLDGEAVMSNLGSSNIIGFRNLQETSRFNVLWDKAVVIHRFGNVNEGSPNLFASPLTLTPIYKFDKTFAKPIKVICSGTGNGINTITDNSFHVIGISNDTTQLLNYKVRIRFTG